MDKEKQRNDLVKKVYDLIAETVEQDGYMIDKTNLAEKLGVTKYAIGQALKEIKCDGRYTKISQNCRKLREKKPRKENLQVKNRTCLWSGCGKTFKSTGPGDRKCPSCRANKNRFAFESMPESFQYVYSG
jgi:hypothetical protein